jgi:hypothetical protein
MTVGSCDGTTAGDSAEFGGAVFSELGVVGIAGVSS